MVKSKSIASFSVGPFPLSMRCIGFSKTEYGKNYYKIDFLQKSYKVDEQRSDRPCKNPGNFKKYTDIAHMIGIHGADYIMARGTVLHNDAEYMTCN